MVLSWRGAYPIHKSIKKIIKPALYRIEQVAEILNISKRTVYRLLIEGKLVAHSSTPGKSEIKILAESVDEYLQKYQLSSDYFLDKDLPSNQSKRKVISKGVE